MGVERLLLRDFVPLMASFRWVGSERVEEFGKGNGDNVQRRG